MSAPNPFPHIAAPVGAADIGDWYDLDHPEDTYRAISSERQGTGPHYVQALAIQESDGTVVEASIHAEINVHCHYHADWATDLSPEQARAKAAELRATIAQMGVLADAFDAAAHTVDNWTGEENSSPESTGGTR